MSDRPIVFVVDDDAAVRESLKFLIESTSFEVKTFSSALEFLQGYKVCVRRASCLIFACRK